MDGDGAGPNAITVVFDTFKKETFTPSKGLKQLQRRLKMQYNIIENKEGIEQSIYNVRNTQIAVFWGPREKFTKSEFAVIKNYLEDGGSVFMLLGEGGEGKYGTNINFLLEEYGIYINSDCAVRSVYHKYLHPKEVLISNGVLNRELSHAIARLPGASKSERESVDLSSTQHDLHGGLEIVFPYGATLNVQKPAIPLLSTGQESYPLNRPVLAVYDGKLLHKQGKLIVLGSDKVFNDEWLLKEENGKLLDVLMKWLVPGQEIKLNSNDAEDPDINEYHHVPDTGALASRVRCCLQVPNFRLKRQN
uniref:IFT52 GIFT domain-containing protein n=1 Tax=Guillardia theta TaxID=55529 RepID=A0A7S4H8T0_GUITH